MRVVRVLVGMLTVLLAVPVLGAGAFAWWVMQHRSPDGTFQAHLGDIDAPNRIVVVPDVDAMLHRDAPIARAAQTQLRVTVANGGFVGMAAPSDLAGYLAGVNYTELQQTRLGQGPLAVRVRQVTSTGDPLAPVEAQHFWVRSGTGALQWSPAADRDRHVALIVIAPPGDGPIHLQVALAAGWLNSTTWGLLILGPVLLLLGLAALAWPQRPREIVYVVASPQSGVPAQVFAAVPLPSYPASSIALPATVAASGVAASGVAEPESPVTTGEARVPSSRRGEADRDPRGRFAAALVPQPATAGDNTGDAAEPAAWPPSEPDSGTEPPRHVRTLADDLFGVLPYDDEDDDDADYDDDRPTVPADLPMPTAGMHLHLTKPRR